MNVEEIKNSILEIDASVSYVEGSIVNINGKPHQLFRNPFLNNELIWAPLSVPPTGYKEVDEECIIQGEQL